MRGLVFAVLAGALSSCVAPNPALDKALQSIQADKDQALSPSVQADAQRLRLLPIENLRLGMSPRAVLRGMEAAGYREATSNLLTMVDIIEGRGGSSSFFTYLKNEGSAVLRVEISFTNEFVTVLHWSVTKDLRAVEDRLVQMDLMMEVLKFGNFFTPLFRDGDVTFKFEPVRGQSFTVIGNKEREMLFVTVMDLTEVWRRRVREDR